ncbi:hypothetical protein HanPSC8_Chr02g0055881 [Helianthus annuus]|nr:hypothetical protein HanPSC8_Chr02g0055881 [Helianthus annuus]
MSVSWPILGNLGCGKLEANRHFYLYLPRQRFITPLPHYHRSSSCLLTSPPAFPDSNLRTLMGELMTADGYTHLAAIRFLSLKWSTHASVSSQLVRFCDYYNWIHTKCLNKCLFEL